MPTHRAIRRTGPSPFAGWVALVAMALQFAFFADHIGANAVAGVGAAGAGDRMGFLEICTGDGIVLLSADGTPVAAADGCVICASAAVLAFVTPFAWTAPVFDVVEIARLPHVPVLGAETAARFPGAKPIRAPPAARPA
jgi:hypothetical protein